MLFLTSSSMNSIGDKASFIIIELDDIKTKISFHNTVTFRTKRQLQEKIYNEFELGGSRARKPKL